MILNIIDRANIGRLNIGEIAFPNLDFNRFEDLNRNRTTLKGAYTTIERYGPPEMLVDLDWNFNGDIVWQNGMLAILYDRIFQLIKEYYQNPTNELLIKIFTFIQLWGGNGGRGIYVNGRKWMGNFNLETYLKAVKLIEEVNYKSALKELNSINYFGISFATKHIHFWSQGGAPIFDSIISKIVFGRKYPRESEYSKYIESIDKLILELGNPEITRMKVERTLFNWAETDEAQNWVLSRINQKFK